MFAEMYMGVFRFRPATEDFGERHQTPRAHTAFHARGLASTFHGPTQPFDRRLGQTASRKTARE